MTRIQELKLRVQRLPELTEKATLVETTKNALNGLVAAHEKLAPSRAAAIELKRIVTEIGVRQLESEASTCCENVSQAAEQALQLRDAITEARGSLLPPNIEKYVQSIATAADKAATSMRRLWNQIVQVVVRDQSPLLEVASRVGISGAAAVSDRLQAIADCGMPATPEDTAAIITCRRQASEVLDSLPQEGPVGAFLEKLVRGDGASLSELSKAEVRAFVKQHNLEERLVIRLAT